MRKETQEKFIVLPIKLEHKTYTHVYRLFSTILNVIIALGCITLASIVIAGVCWFTIN